ncbi:MAG: methylmalonyl-CoA mutase [Nocardioidaceae bacterium]|nr:methylmalonyl-CoA mutase [Nocardioidaceae bacterium]
MTSSQDAASHAAPEAAPASGPIALEDGAAHSRADWESSAAAVLRKAGRLGADDPDAAVWDKLTRTTLDGIEITPLGTAGLLDDLATSGRPNRQVAWEITAHVADPDAAASAADVRTDLDNGATALWVQLGAGGIAVQDLPTVLDGVLLDVAPVALESDDPVAAAEAFAALATGTTLAGGTTLGADPLGAQLLGRDADLAQTAEVARIATDLGCGALVVDGTAAHDLGASDAQELGWSLAVGAAYLRALVDAGYDVSTAAGLISFRYAATDEQFPTIAKLRAARRGWDRVLELSGVPAEARLQYQHVVTSRPMMSKYDPWVNMLRTCVAAFAAGVGGADSVTVLPFDAHLGLPDAFSRRVARNTSSLLVHESHLAKVADPAGGAYAVEKLTDDLARSGWAELGAIEEAGGALAAIDGFRERIAGVVLEREGQIARRKRPLTGLSEFPNLHETLPERKPYAAGARPVRPYGHEFEALRDEPAAGKVFLATLGTVAAHTSRATFASNLFAAGGIDVEVAGATDGAEALAARYEGQPVVCLTGSDAAYAEWGVEAATALRAKGAAWVVIAGKATDYADDHCALGIDALAFLRRTREKLA